MNIIPQEIVFDAKNLIEKNSFNSFFYFVLRYCKERCDVI